MSLQKRTRAHDIFHRHQRVIGQNGNSDASLTVDACQNGLSERDVVYLICQRCEIADPRGTAHVLTQSPVVHDRALRFTEVLLLKSCISIYRQRRRRNASLAHLLVGDKMLHASRDPGALNAVDCLHCRHTREIRIGAPSCGAEATLEARVICPSGQKTNLPSSVRLPELA